MSQDNDDAEHEFLWVYGFDVADGIRTAWRKLIDNAGADVIAKESASHFSAPPGGIGLMIAHFLDGTTAEVPGMLAEPRPQPTKRNAASQGAAGSSGKVQRMWQSY